MQTSKDQREAYGALSQTHLSMRWFDGRLSPSGLKGWISPLAPWFPQQAARFCRDTFSKRDVRGAKVSFLIIMCEVLGIRLSWLASLLRMAYRPAYGDS